MADRMTFAWILLLACGSCLAQEADPTRPPAFAGAPGAVAAAAGPVLQSVILPRGKGRKPAAIISGERIELGGRYGEWRLARLSESEAVLVGTAGRQVLRLTPEAAKRSAPRQEQRE